jgi:hypothetical protein
MHRFQRARRQARRLITLVCVHACLDARSALPDPCIRRGGVMSTLFDALRTPSYSGSPICSSALYPAADVAVLAIDGTQAGRHGDTPDTAARLMNDAPPHVRQRADGQIHPVRPGREALAANPASTTGVPGLLRERACYPPATHASVPRRSALRRRRP